MPTTSNSKLTTLVEQITAHLKSCNGDAAVPPEEFEEYYKKLVAVGKFWDVPNVSWDDVVKESGEEWIGTVRKDKQFREYYKLRKEWDEEWKRIGWMNPLVNKERLEVLANEC